MTTSRKSATREERDPDLAGAEVAMHRAARRARQRAEQASAATAGRLAAERGSDRRRVETDPLLPEDVSSLNDGTHSFSLAHGYEEIPAPLKLEELPQEARTGIWDLFYRHVSACLSEDTADRERSLESLGVLDSLEVGPWIRDPWKAIMRAKHIEFDKQPLDTWDSDFKRICNELRDNMTSLPFNRVFDMIQFVLRHPDCSDGFMEAMKQTFSDCRLAYVIDAGPPAAIVPAATREEGDQVVESIRVLREAGLDGSASHLRQASEHLNAGDWAGSVRESIHAVESVARQLDPGGARKLGPALSSLERRGGLHPALRGAFSKLYGYTSDQQGIRHPLLDQADARVGQEEALFMLGACASFVGYLWRKHGSAERQ